VTSSRGTASNPRAKNAGGEGHSAQEAAGAKGTRPRRLQGAGGRAEGKQGRGGPGTQGIGMARKERRGAPSCKAVKEAAMTKTAGESTGPRGRDKSAEAKKRGLP